MIPRRMILRWSVVLVLSGAAAGVASAETLTDAWALALQQDHSLAAARHQAEAAGFEAQAARAQRCRLRVCSHRCGHQSRGQQRSALHRHLDPLLFG